MFLLPEHLNFLNAVTPQQRRVQPQVTHAYQKSSSSCHFQEVIQKLRGLEQACRVESSNRAVKNTICMYRVLYKPGTAWSLQLLLVWLRPAKRFGHRRRARLSGSAGRYPSALWSRSKLSEHEQMIFAKCFVSMFKLDYTENSYSLHKVTFLPSNKHTFKWLM